MGCAHRRSMDTAKEWYAAVKEWRARDELTAAIAAIKWPNPTMGCLESYDRAYAHETAARERMNQAYERGAQRAVPARRGGIATLPRMKNSSSALHIRPARREDAPALVDLLMRTYETTWMPQMSAQADSRFRASGKTAAYVAERGLRFHVCELDGTVAGMVDWEGNFIWALHAARHAATRRGRRAAGAGRGRHAPGRRARSAPGNG